MGDRQKDCFSPEIKDVCENNTYLSDLISLYSNQNNDDDD